MSPINSVQVFVVKDEISFDVSGCSRYVDCATTNIEGTALIATDSVNNPCNGEGIASAGDIVREDYPGPKIQVTVINSPKTGRIYILDTIQEYENKCNSCCQTA